VEVVQIDVWCQLFDGTLGEHPVSSVESSEVSHSVYNSLGALRCIESFKVSKERKKSK
jgi:hypothetical protein